MTEVVNNQEAAPEVVDTPAETSQPDVFESKAQEMGWRPKTEWDGDEADFIDAKEFVRRQPLFEKIERQSKDIKELRQAFDALKTHHSKVKETEYSRALDSLKQARRDALKEGDTERALVYEDKIDEISQQKAEFDQEAKALDAPKHQGEHPDFVSWKSRNGWYAKDAELREFADTYGAGLKSKVLSGQSTPQEVMELVSKQVRKAFPEKFKNPNQDKPGAVEAPSRQGKTNDGFSMSEDETNIMNKLVRAGAFGDDITKAKAAYIKELKRVKGL